MHDRTRMLQAHSLANPEHAAGPACIDEPALRIVLLEPASEHFCVHSRCKGQARRSKARRELRDRLAAQSRFRSGELRGVTREEVIHRLLRRELRNRRQYTESVSRQKEQVLWMAAHAWNYGILNKLDRIRGARVFGKANVRIIRLTRHRIEHNIFQY